MMKIERLTATPADDPWYVRSQLDAAWDSIYWTFPETTRDTRWFDWTVEVPF